MKQIPLGNERFALVDDCDYERLSLLGSWRAMREHSVKKEKYYAVRNYTAGKREVKEAMHANIIQAPPGLQTDHIDGNGLNNCRSNLRCCTGAQNQHNMRASWGLSQYKGVTWNKRTRMWQAQIGYYGSRFYLGLFSDEKDAALAYDLAAVLLFGEFACTNGEMGLLS